MPRQLRTTLAVFLLLCSTPTLFAQQLETYSSEEFDIQFKLPGRWKVETSRDKDVPTLLATSPDGTLSLVVLSFKDSTISTEDLLAQAIDNLDWEVEGEVEEGELNGMDVFQAIGRGQMRDGPIGFAIQAMTYDDNNHVAYVFTSLDAFKRNAKMMDQILESFSPRR